ncbi:unnamed protein product [Spodoptera littoralis]|uniref:Regulatory protein zeste n=1 Tax=Spodoptera littoralis TaxID=7109 RepID=A0A9P0N9H7_SPOLI|nr:unnamed protein product [Spodoptera littoralis]CAH1644706.1 unnamed protein product [Spodoptera littoralis]
MKTKKPKRKQVSYDQLTALLDFLKEHEDLARGLTRGRRRRGKFHTVKVWNMCAKKLNAIKNGALKDGKGWSKYWCDWKYRVRRRALELKAAKDGDRPLPEGILPLSPMEENIMALIGDNIFDGVVIMNDPLSEEGFDEHYAVNADGSPIDQYYDPTEPSARRKRQKTSNDNGAGPSSPPDRKPTIDLAASGDMKGLATGTRSKRRRKHRSPVTSDMDYDASGSNSSCKPEGGTRNEQCVESECDDKASAFLSIEREKVFGTNKIITTLEMIHTEIARLTSVMADIKDCLVTNYRQISVT